MTTRIMIMTKNKSMVAVVILLVVISIIAFVLVYESVTKKGITDKKDKGGVEVVIEDEKLICELENDQAYFEVALSKGDMSQCQCMTDVESKNRCLQSTEQAILYQQAIAQVDNRICAELKVEEQKNACNNVVNSKKEYLGSNNAEQLAYTYLYNHNDKEAIVILEKMLSKNNEDVKSLINVAFAYSNQVIYGSLTDEQKKSNINKALASAKKAQELDSNNSEAYRAEGFAYEAAERLDEALDVYISALQKFPQDILLLNGRGHVESMLGFLRNAIETFELATSLDSNMQHPAAWMNLCRLQAGESISLGKAKENCQKVSDMDTSNANEKSEALQVIAQILLIQNQSDKALDKLKYARTLSPMNDNIYSTMASVYNKKGDGMMAEQMAKKSLDINEFKTSAYFELANGFYNQKKYDEAIVEAKKGLAVIDKDVSLLLPNKPKMKMDMYYLLHDAYNGKGDQKSAQSYKALANENAKILNLNF